MVTIDEAYVRQKCFDSTLLGGTTCSSTRRNDNTTTGTTTTDCEHTSSITHLDVDVVGSSCEGGSVKISLTIVAKTFLGVTLIKRHRLVNDIFATELKDNSIHALSVNAYTPEQWDTKQQKEDTHK